MGDVFDDSDRDDESYTTVEYTDEEKERLYNNGGPDNPWTKEDIEKFVEALPKDETFDVDVFRNKSKYYNFSFWKWDFLIRIRREKS